MFKKICSLIVLSFVAISSFLSAGIEYDIQDIGTLQTHSSQTIALNNKGQILGWYNVDGSQNGKHFFVRNRSGEFHEIPSKTLDAGLVIDWQYLTDEGKAYGIFAVNQATTALCVWDQINGFIKLGVIPGKDIVAINNSSQVLIKSVVENENGKSIRRPVIWENGKITKLKGLEGDLGIESEESYGFDMNNQGSVVGQSVVYLSYKNNIYKQIHATKWINGQAIDLHTIIPKNTESCAIAINDIGDVLISAGHNAIYFVRNDNQIFMSDGFYKNLNNQFRYSDRFVRDRDDKVLKNTMRLNELITNDINSIWMKITKLVSVNDNGEIIAQGETIYGEQHAMFLAPLKSN